MAATMQAAGDVTQAVPASGAAPVRADATRPPALVGAAVFSDDPRRLVALYEELLGLGFEHRAHDDGREHWVTDLGAVHVEVKATRDAHGHPTPDALDAARGTGRTELSFTVASASGSVSLACRLGCTVVQEARRHAWGEFGAVLDVDGNRIGLYTPPALLAEPDTTSGADSTEGQH